jgi:ribosomal protein L11 methyltransferase
MGWLALSLELEADRAEALADALLEGGALSVEITDAQAGTALERPIFGEPGAAPDGAWSTSNVCALFDAEADVDAIARAALATVEVAATPPLSIRAVPEQDWVRASQEQFTPVQISPRLWIVPSWCEVPDPSAINLRLDPGLAFGTGGHPTTWQCLRWLESNLAAGALVLDYGCGSGVLAIAAKKLGAGRVLGVDIDPRALEVSRDNAVVNAVEIELTGPDSVPAGPYDVVLANILSNPLRLLAPLLAGLTRPGGKVVLAGILNQQAASVTAAYAGWYDMQVASEKDGWTCLAGKRRLFAP